MRHHDDLVHLAGQVKEGTLSRRTFLALAAAAGFAVPFADLMVAPRAAQAAPARQDKPKQGGQLIVGFSQEPTVFNPLKSTLEVDRGVQYSLFDSLWRIDEKAALVANLATEVPTVENGGIAKDGLSYTFKLRDDAKWHDGQPFTAQDVLFNHATIMNPDFAAGNRIGHDRIKEISAPDDHTVTMTLSEAYAPFLIAWMDTYLVPEHLLKDVKDLNTADFNSTAPVGTGPFKWQERVAGDHITLVANPDYHLDGPYLDTLIFKYVPDLTVFFTQFKTGDIDVTGIQGITADNYNEAKGLQGVVIHDAPTAFVEFIYMNFGKPVFQDKAVREALYSAMDKANIIDKVYYGIHKPSETYLPEDSWAINTSLTPQVFDVEAAKKTLDAAGWAAGADGIRAKDGTKLSFTNSTTAGNKVREQAQQYLQQTWKEAGVDMQINNMPAAVIWGDYWLKSQFDSVMVGLHTGLGADPDAVTRFSSKSIPAQGGGGQNYSQYKNADLDPLLDQGAAEIDQAKRKEIYLKVQEILRDDLAYLPIFHYTFVEGTKDGMIGYKANPFVVSNQWNTNEWGWTP